MTRRTRSGRAEVRPAADGGPGPISSMVPITVTPVLVADLLVEGERMPVYAYLVEHPDARVLVDTGLMQPHPLTADLDPRPYPLDTQDLDVASIDLVVNTHLHFDHCGGNRLFPGTPIHVQRAGWRTP